MKTSCATGVVSALRTRAHCLAPNRPHIVTSARVYTRRNAAAEREASLASQRQIAPQMFTPTSVDHLGEAWDVSRVNGIPSRRRFPGETRLEASRISARKKDRG